MVKKVFVLLPAFGCSDIIAPEDSWLKRSGDAIVIGCYTSRQSWHLVCMDDKWFGTFGNCTYANMNAFSEKSPHSETDTKVNDKWRNTLIIICIASTTFVINVFVITCGICAFTQIRASYLSQKVTANKVKKKVTFTHNSQDVILDTGNANIQPRLTARVLPISYREPPAVTSSMPNILSNDLESGSACPYLIPTELDYAPAFLDLAESYRRRIPTRSRECNYTSGYLLPNELRSQIRRNEYLDLVDDESIQFSVKALQTYPEPGYLTPNKFKPLLRAHDYPDMVDDTTLPRKGPHGSNHRKLLPTGFRGQSRQHEYLDLIDYDPNRSSLRRCQSDSFSEYLVPSELREQVYTNDYMHLAERDLDRPTVYASLKPSSADASIPTKNPRK